MAMGNLSNFLAVTATAVVAISAPLHLQTIDAFSPSPPIPISRKRPATTTILSKSNINQRSSRGYNYNYNYNGVHTNNNPASASVSASVVCHSTAAVAAAAAAIGDPVIAASTSFAATRIIKHGVTTFMGNWKAYSLIPLVAGFVGWLTNYLAVQMIFYPIRWRGLPIYKVEGEPLGLFGWQGIIPAKTLKMTESMVNTTINELLTMDEIIQRLDPDTVADILLPTAGQIVQPFVDELLADRPQFVMDFATNYTSNTNGWLQQKVAHKFLRDLTIDVQKQIGKICNLRNCVVNMMMSDRSKLGKLFQISGKDELAFLVDSGLIFGFMLGIIQLFVAVYWDNPWTLSVGGLIVGLATNWLALKWIFEPVNPLKLGPVVLQGLFLRRQNEVSADFSEFFANEVLTSRQLWKSMLTDPTTLPEWEKLLAKRFASFTRDVTFGTVDLEEQKPRKLKAASARLCATLYDYLEDVHGYVDEALEIDRTLRARMMAMTSAQFERVLHPIFEEDEMTLILSGGGLGFLAGLVQQLLSTGSIKLPKVSFGSNADIISLVGSIFGMYVFSIAMKPRKKLVLFVTRLIERTRRLKRKTYRYLKGTRRSKTKVEKQT